MDHAATRHVLSERGRRLLEKPPMPEYLAEHFERRRDPYEPATNPSGYIGLCVAENKLVWPLLEPRVHAPREVPAEALAYDDMIGNETFRRRIAGFMSRAFLGREIGYEQVAVLAGGGSVLEILFYAIADPGDAVLIPTPSYAGFWMDLETRDDLTIVPVHTAPDDGFRLSADLLEAAVAATERPVRALLFTSPSNPTGYVYAAAEIEEVIGWAERAGVHLVLDEIYALSVYGDRPFVSGASLRPGFGERTHLVWAFSKDFGASGLRCGVLVTENEEVMAAVDSLAYWAACSGDTQHLLGEMIGDDDWVNGYVKGMRDILGSAYQRVTATLDDVGIGYFPAAGGFFLLVDLRPHLETATWEAERSLWRRIVDGANVNLTPGAACRNGEPGLFRVCFATEAIDTVQTGLRRVGALLADQR